MARFTWRSRDDQAEEARQAQTEALKAARDRELTSPDLLARLLAPADEAERDAATAYARALRGSPEEAATADVYEVGVAYEAGKLLRYEGIAYAVITGHISQADWTPDQEGSLYRRLGAVDLLATSDALPWTPPTGAHDAYNTGDEVSYQGSTYRSLIDGNTTVPGSDPRWWEAL